MTWSPSQSWWLRGVLAVGVLVVLITEGLGALRMIAPLPVALCWAVVIGGALIWHRRRTGRWAPALPQAIPISQVHPAWWVVGVFLAVTFLIGVASAPNSWDALTYHLPRIERWVEQGHLGFWPTSVDRQLWMSPWPGYVGLHLRLLTGGDSLAFLPAWLGYLGCVVLSAALGRQLGGTARDGAFAALVMATIPVAVLQASAVQTDVIAGFWSLAAITLVVEAWREPKGLAGWRLPLLLATATSLAFGSKGTAALALAPWFALLAGTLLRQRDPAAIGRLTVAGVAVIAALNLPHLMRTQRIFGSPLGASWTLDMLRLNPLTPGRVSGNLVANLSLHAGLPWEGWNTQVQRVVLGANEALGVDPAVQYRFYDGFRINAFSVHESEAGMPGHLLLLASGLLGVMVAGRRPGWPPGLVGFALAGTAALLLLLGILRWQPFGARLQLVGLLWLPALAPWLVRSMQVRLAATIALVALAVPALLFGTPRPLLGPHSVLTTTRSEQFARERPEHFAAVEMVVLAAGVERCERVGLMTGWDHPEYFLSAVVRREGTALRSEHLISIGVPSRLDETGPSSEICVLLSAEPLPGLETPWLSPKFGQFWSVPAFSVYTLRGGVGR